MPEKRLPMRQVHEILRLHFEAKLKDRQIAKICSVGKGTVRRYLKRLAAAGLSWPLPTDLDEATLECRMFPPPPVMPEGRPLPDFQTVHKELKSRKSVTLQLLWEEYREAYPEGYNYSWYCDRYRKWARKLDIVMRQEHRAGEKTFVDHAGQTVPVVQPVNGRPSYPYRDDEQRKVARDAYVSSQGSRYSMPWQYAGKPVWVREQGGEVEVRYGADRIAMHGQAANRHQVITQNEHHQGIPLGSLRTGKTLIHIQQGAPVVEQRPLEAYESGAGGGSR